MGGNDAKARWALRKRFPGTQTRKLTRCSPCAQCVASPPMDRPTGGRVPPEAQEEDLDQELADMGFLCPITQVLFRDPVVARDGHTYEVRTLLSFVHSCVRCSDARTEELDRRVVSPRKLHVACYRPDTPRQDTTRQHSSERYHRKMDRSPLEGSQFKRYRSCGEGRSWTLLGTAGAVRGGSR